MFENSARSETALMRSLVERSLDMITVLGLDLTVRYQSNASERLLGRAPEELVGVKFGTLLGAEDLARLRRACQEAADGIAPHPVALGLRREDGRLIECEALVRFDADEKCLVLASRDVSERIRAERRHRVRAARQALIVELGAQALAGEDLPGLMAEAATKLAAALQADFVGVLGYAEASRTLVPWGAHGEDPYSALPSITTKGRSQLGRALAAEKPVVVRNWTREERFAEAGVVSTRGFRSAIAVRIAGRGAPCGVIVAHSREEGGFGYEEGVLMQAIANVLAAARARVEGEERIRHLALHDATTGFPNRTLFEDRLTRALATAARHDRLVAVLCLDVDSFNLVREGLGHASGEVLLGVFAARIAECLRREDTLASLGRDQFAVLLPELDSESDVVQVAERIKAALRQPLSVAGREIVTSAAVGIALNHGAAHEHQAQTLMRDADLAMLAAKQRGPGSFSFFAPEMRETAARQLELAADLYQALERGEFDVYFQPIVALQDDVIVAAEALVRWRHPRYGVLAPGAFMAIAEETGLIVPIGRYVLRRACTALRHWQDECAAALSVSVNLGLQQLTDNMLIEDVAEALSDSGLDPARLVLEITEDVLLGKHGVLERLDELKRLGVQLAVDDFGTGYSALSHLQGFPVDAIKIDKSFVDRIVESADQARLVQGVIELTRSLGLKTVAEGIETLPQLDALRAMGSELGQGYHFARPLESRDFEALLAAAAGGELDLPVELRLQA